jgi:hypothetical protein
LNLPSSDNDDEKPIDNLIFKHAEIEDQNDIQAFKESNRGFNQSQQRSGSPSEQLRIEGSVE